MDHRKVAERVIKDVGRDNIIAGAHCATRLRLVLKMIQKSTKKHWIMIQMLRVLLKPMVNIK